MSDTANTAFSYAKSQLANVEKELTKTYKTALDNIRAELSKYNESGSLTQNEMLKYGRLINLKNMIEDEMKSIQSGNYKVINSARQKAFLKAYQEFYAQSGLALPKINTDFIKATLANPLYEAQFKDSLSDITKTSAKKINSVITQGLTQGLSMSDMAKMIKAKIEGYSVKQAKMIARQETLRAMTEGQLSATDKLIQKGFQVVKVWVYNHSPRFPREYHQDMDGVEADKDGYFHIMSPDEGEIITLAPRMSGIASNDINCACSYYNKIIQEEPVIE